MASQTERSEVLECKCDASVDTAALVRAASISGAVSACLVVAVFLIYGRIRRRRGNQQAATPTAPPPPPPPPPPPAFFYNEPADFYAPPPYFYSAPPPPAYPPPIYAPPHNGAGDLEMAAATVGYATAAGTSAAAGCIIM